MDVGFDKVVVKYCTSIHPNPTTTYFQPGPVYLLDA